MKPDIFEGAVAQFDASNREDEEYQKELFRSDLPKRYHIRKTFELDVTPEIAHRLLTDVPFRNRRVRAISLGRYTADMKAGQWMLTPEALMVDWFGRLIGGQHRLLAVIKAGVTVRFTIAVGVDPKVFFYTDQGVKQTPGDKIFGLGDMDADLAGLSEWEADAVSARSGALYLLFSNGDDICTLPAKEQLEVRKTFMPGLKWSLKVFANRRGVDKGAVVGAFVFAWMAYPELAERLAPSFRGGTFSRTDDPLLLLNKELLTTAGKGISRHNLGLKTLTALYCHATNSVKVRHDRYRYALEFFTEKFAQRYAVPSFMENALAAPVEAAA